MRARVTFSENPAEPTTIVVPAAADVDDDAPAALELLDLLELHAVPSKTTSAAPTRAVRRTRMLIPSVGIRQGLSHFRGHRIRQRRLPPSAGAQALRRQRPLHGGEAELREPGEEHDRDR